VFSIFWAVDLLVTQLKAAIRRILETKGVRARVLDKVNRYGEVVIGVILERPAAPPRGAGADGVSSAGPAGDDAPPDRPRDDLARGRDGGADPTH
jgi:hypothetical protein